MTTSPRPFATNLKKARKYWGLTQQQTANKIGIAQKRYEAYETDRSQPPMEVLASLCNLFRIQDVAAFLAKESWEK